MDDQRVGAGFRAVRIRRDWRQCELAVRSGVSPGLISLIERGHLDSVSLRAIRRVAARLDLSVELRIRSRGGDVDRLLILAFHQPSRSVLVIELKSELVDFENLLTTMDIRLRLAPRIARERGWQPVSGWVVVAESRPNRRRAAGQRSTLRSAFPADGRAMRGWLLRPAGAIRVLSFWSNSTGRSTNPQPLHPKACSQAPRWTPSCLIRTQATS